MNFVMPSLQPLSFGCAPGFILCLPAALVVRSLPLLEYQVKQLGMDVPALRADDQCQLVVARGNVQILPCPRLQTAATDAILQS